jgi:dienelactone hydrolase
VLRIACALGSLVLLVTGAAAETTVLPGLLRTPLWIPVALSDGRKVALESLVIRPDRPGRFPLVVLVHGTPRGEGATFLAEIARRSPAVLNEPSVAFAQRGYAAVSIMRRGFGRSDGPYAERLSGACDNRDYLAVGRASAEDVVGAVAALRHEPWVDPDRVLLLGLSTGGFAVTAAAATNPSGVVGVLDFAGGRGSPAPDKTCSADRLVADIGVFGRTARVPALWIYAENDHFFGPALARRMFASYVAAGAPARLEMLPPSGADGHRVLVDAPNLWWPPIAAFLASLKLPTEVVVELPLPPPLASPPALNCACYDYFRNYVAARIDAKAFAVNPDGHCGYSVAARSLDEAKDEAMRWCRDRWPDCKLYAAGQELVARENRQ